VERRNPSKTVSARSTPSKKNLNRPPRGSRDRFLLLAREAELEPIRDGSRGSCLCPNCLDGLLHFHTLDDGRLALRCVGTPPAAGCDFDSVAQALRDLSSGLVPVVDRLDRSDIAEASV